MALIYEELIAENRPQFVAAVVKVAELLGVDPNNVPVFVPLKSKAA